MTRLLHLLCLAFILLAPGLAAAQVPAAPAPAAKPAEADPERVRALIGTLQDDKARAELIARLQLMLQAQEPPADKQTTLEAVGSQALVAVSDKMRDVTGGVAVIGSTLAQSPQLLVWARDQLGDPDARARWIAIFLNVLGVFVAGLAAGLLVVRLLRGARRALDRHPPATLWGKLPLILGQAVLDFLPLLAFVFAAYGVTSVLAPPQFVTIVVTALVYAALISGVALMLIRIVLTPEHPRLRLLHIGDETAGYLYIWSKRLIRLTVFGYLTVVTASVLELPYGGLTALTYLVGLVIVAMLVVLILQNRHPVADWLRGRRHGAAGDDAAVTRAVGTARRRFADVWHLVAIAYVGATFVIWALGINGGFAFILRATVLTVLALVLARLVSLYGPRLIHRAFSIGPELKGRYPGLEQRANRYLPVLDNALKIIVTIATILVLLEVWQLGGIAWMETETGRAVLQSGGAILFMLVASLVAWEVVSQLIEFHLNRHDSTGRLVQRSARVRTLLPLLRNAFLILLITVAVLMILSEVGLNIAPLLAGAGVVGLAIGFGAQTLVKDVITGVFILFEDTLAIGDVVQLGSDSGSVETITIRTIRLRDETGAVHTIPFSSVTSIINMTKDFSFAVFNIGIGYDQDVDNVIEVLRDLGRELQLDPEWAPNILAPIEVIGLDKFGESTVTIKARIKTPPIKQWGVMREFNRRMKRRFDELGIDLPFPHRMVLTRSLDKPDGDAATSSSAAQGASS
ncbi:MULTISPECIES: mechanosensitive ion channel domain-containing protein [Inquilinus]|uniref:Small conductance mechanosensitive channel n=1 Tax=Inquilinus ginsengisoli TaxID=363840 RepID=A0ABU1JYZ8_9PROT|nr:mechanosensitive ion channel domain-containing protein [Inquilinus ginsengisoli]MDR6293502.1 small conductance mechanosensitive channel [Inquilinus ginsengisoli]